MEPVLRSQRRQVRRGCRAAAWWGRRPPGLPRPL